MCSPAQGLSKALLYLAMNTAGLFIHYLSDRTQRQSFLETRRCIEGRVRLERENQRQVESSQIPDQVISSESASPHVVSVLPRSVW